MATCSIPWFSRLLHVHVHVGGDLIWKVVWQSQLNFGGGGEGGRGGEGA